MNTRNNSRFQETDQRIREAFLEELKEKGIDRIRVSEICAKVGINRSSFYAHYEDVYDILEKLSDSIGREFFDMFQKSYRFDTREMIQKGYLLELLEHIYDHREFYGAYFSGTNSEHLNKGLNTVFYDLIYPELKALGVKDESTAEFHFIFFRAGLFALIRRWLEEGCRKSAEEVADIIMGSIRTGGQHQDRFFRAPDLA